MKKLLMTAAALALLSTTAHAYEINCSAPRMLFTVDNAPDTNPVVNVEVRYEPQDHAWRVFHTLRDGRVVSRSEQYSITDGSTDNMAQWSGSHGKMRHLFMIGEVRRGPNGITYHEWQYNRNTNVMQFESVSVCRVNAPVVAQSEPPRYQPVAPQYSQPVPQYQQRAAGMYFRAERDVLVRTGPGSNHNLLGTIPAGVEIPATRCTPRDDGIAGADWCWVAFRGLEGWASRAHMMPL